MVFGQRSAQMPACNKLATIAFISMAVLSPFGSAHAAQCGNGPGGMESGFGSQRGNQNMLASIATLAYDCRRPEFFTEQLYAALKLVDRGTLSGATRGSMHGEVGQTQFMPKNILAYGTGNLDVATNALNSTAAFLRAHGWRAGAGYQPGEPNFAAIEAWNAASVYQRAIALMGRQIDCGVA